MFFFVLKEKIVTEIKLDKKLNYSKKFTQLAM